MVDIRLPNLRSILFVAVALWLVPQVAIADNHADWVFNTQIENDKAAATDRHYTNGLRVSLLSPENGVPDWMLPLWQHLPLLDPSDKKRIGLAAGQSIFTPDDIGASRLIQDDRPYAGWLYGSVALLSYDDDNLQTFAIDLGVVGPASLAEETQIFVHNTIDVTVPNGWKHQLDNELGFVLSYERKWRHLYNFQAIGLDFDVTPHIAASAGNVFTLAAGGASIRFGENLRKDFGPPRIRPSLPGSSFYSSQGGFGWYIFAGAEGRAVLRNIFLDGNTFRDSHSVDKLPFVGDFQTGLAVTFWNTRLAYTHVYRTREFKEQSEGDRFGAISLSVKF